MIQFKPGTRRENLRRYLKFRLYAKVRTKFLRWKRNRNRPEDHYIDPRLTVVNLPYGPYRTWEEFDVSFDEIPKVWNGPLSTIPFHIRMPWEV